MEDGFRKTNQELQVSTLNIDLIDCNRVECLHKEQEAILSSFYNSSPFMMGVVELSDHDILHISDNITTATFFQTTPEAMSGKWSSELGVDSEYIQLWLTHYHLSQEQKHPIKFEYAHTQKNRIYWLSVTVSFIGFAVNQSPRFSYVAEDISDRKQSELLIQESEERFRYLADHAPVLIWLSGLDKLCYHFNQKWLEFTGRTMEQEMGNGWAEGVYPEDFQHCLDTYINSFDARQPFEMEYRLKRVDGEYRWLLDTGVPRFDANGEFLGYIGSCIDISDRKQAEAALRESEARWQFALEGAGGGAWDWNLQTNEAFLSRRWKAMLGFEEHEISNNSSDWDRMLHPDDKEAVYAEINKHLRGETEQSVVEYRIQCKDGSYKWILGSGKLISRTADGAPLRFIGTNIDISDRKQAELSLQQSEAKYRHLINNFHAGVVVHAPDTSILLCNAIACQLLGLTEDQMLGKTAIDSSWHFCREDGTVMPLEEYPVQQVFSTGLPLKNYIAGINQHNRTRVWVLVNAFPEFNASQKLEQIVITFVDISDRKQAELDLQFANQQLSDHIAELNQRHWEMVKLSEISDFLQACFTVEEACKALSHLIEPLFPNCAGSIFITNASRDRVEVMSFWGEALHSEVAFLPNDCWALRRGRVHFVDRKSGLYCNHILLDEEIDVTLCIPMIAQGETIGLFHLSNNKATALTESKQQLAKTLAEQIGLAIANLRLQETLKQQSIRDPLTGLFNRRYLEESLNQELSRAQRQQHQIGVIMLDIDHFKRFNDSYGHDAGDYVLQTVGSLLKAHVRGFDIACRYGGEEMILVLPDSSLEIASKRAEEIREAIAKVSLTHNGQVLGSLTASLGVASFPQHGSTGSSVITAADAALYRAKAAGRNQVLIAQ
jgi:diguanylate cyclase (GGDEF)-like protein/PAS domain S-box-containing protein